MERKTLSETSQECHDTSPKKRSIVVPDDEVEEIRYYNFTRNLHINVKRLLKNIATVDFFLKERWKTLTTTYKRTPI